MDTVNGQWAPGNVAPDWLLATTSYQRNQLEEKPVHFALLETGAIGRRPKRKDGCRQSKKYAPCPADV